MSVAYNIPGSGDMTPPPSSLLPALSGIPNYPSGYVTVQDKLSLLQNGSGLFTGNFADFVQERDFNPAFLVNVHGVNALGKDLPGFNGKGINKYYTSPASYAFGNTPSGVLHGTSGIFITYPPSGNEVVFGHHPSFPAYRGSSGTGIFNFKELLSNLSNAKESKDKTGAAGIDDFTIFNPYIHYLPYEEEATQSAIPNPLTSDEEDLSVKIPFLSDLIPTANIWDRYGTIEEEDETDETDPDYGD